MGDLLELAVVGDFKNVIAAIMQIIAGAADRAQRGVARDNAGKRDGFLRLEAGRGGAQVILPGVNAMIGSTARREKSRRRPRTLSRWAASRFGEASPTLERP
jgi:hypothetical protein